MWFMMLKATCLACYALALAGLVGWLPGGLAASMQTIAAGMLIVHLLELLLMFRFVRLYPGTLTVSVVLTLLFGLLHWKPLADAQARTQAKKQGGT